MDRKLIDLFFKALAGGLIPIMFWVNAQSVDIAVLKGRVDNLEKRLVVIETRLDKIDTRYTQRALAVDSKFGAVGSDINANNLTMREFGVTLRFINEIVEDIRHALKQ